MSGYLWRLASSVLSPRRSVHPYVGSVFAAPGYPRALGESFVDQFETIDSVSTSGGLRSDQSLSGPAESIFSGADERTPAVSPMTLEHDTPARPFLEPPMPARTGPVPAFETIATSSPSSSRPAQPGVPQVQSAQYRFESPAAPRELSPTETRRHSPAAGTPAVMRHPQRISSPPEQPRRLNPPLLASLSGSPLRKEVEKFEIPALLEEMNNNPPMLVTRIEPAHTPEEASSSRAPADQPPCVTATRKTRSTGLPTRSTAIETKTAPSHQEPDEIHIHIGRIVVTAVPQPQARTVDRPARKTPSLEEYLRRRDGRGS